MKKIVAIALNIALDIGGYFLWSALAMAERGYKGVGGEWFLILGLPVLWGYITWEYIERRRVNEASVWRESNRTRIASNTNGKI